MDNRTKWEKQVEEEKGIGKEKSWKSFILFFYFSVSEMVTHK